jgi:hypothetical protein
MARTVELNVNVDVNTKSVEDLKLELQALESEFESVGVGTKRFNELGNSIKGIKSQLKDVELQFEGLDKEQRATALVDVFTGLVGAVGAVSSAFIAFGADSENIENAEKKLLGVIGVVNGLRDASNGLLALNKLTGNSFTTLGNTIAAGFKKGATAAQTFKSALIATGIGALIVAVGFLIENFDKLGLATESEKDKTDRLSKANDDLKASIDLANESIDAETQLLKAQGVEIEKINALKIKGLEVANQQLAAQVQEQTQEIFSYYQDLNRELTEDEEATVAKLEELRTKNENNIKKNSAAILGLKAEVIKEGKAADDKADDKAEKKRQEREAKQKDAASKELKAVQDKYEALRKLDEVNATEGLDLITTQFANNLSRIKEAGVQELAQENLTAAAIKAIKAKTNADIAANEAERLKAVDEFTKAKDEKDVEDAKKKAEELAALRTRIADAEAVSEDQRRAREKEKLILFYDELIAEATKNGIDVTTLNQAKNDALAKQNEEFATTDLDKQKQYRQKLVDLAFDSALSLINDLQALNGIYDKDNKDAAKKAFDREKSLASVSTIIETYLSASKAYASQIIPGDPTSIIRASIAAAVAVASGLARLKVIQSQQFDGDTASGPSGGGAAAGGGGGGFTFSQTTQGTFTPGGTPQTGGVTGQGGIQQGGAQTGGNVTPVVKAYVLSGDVTDAQEAELKINQKRKF